MSSYIEPVTAIVTVSANVGTASSVVIMQANPNRKSFCLYNAGGNSAYITYGPTSNSTNPSAIVASFSNYNSLPGMHYCGAISAIRNAGSGTFTVTEFV